MIAWNDVEAAREYRRERIQKAVAWRIAHEASSARDSAKNTHSHLLAQLGVLLSRIGAYLQEHYGEAQSVIGLTILEK